MRTLLFAANILAFLALASSSRGQDLAWQRAYDSAKQAFAEHRYSDADQAYQAALAQAEDFEPGDPRLSSTLFGLGTDYYVERRYEEAEPLFLRVVELREARPTPDRDLVKALLQLAELYRAGCPTRRFYVWGF
jgi:TolA-binding protein